MLLRVYPKFPYVFYRITINMNVVSSWNVEGNRYCFPTKAEHMWKAMRRCDSDRWSKLPGTLKALLFLLPLLRKAEMHVGWAHYWSRWWNPGQREKESCHGAPPFSISSQGMKSECVRLKLSLESTHSKSSSELSDDQRVKLSVMQARFWQLAFFLCISTMTFTSQRTTWWSHRRSY